MNRILLTAGVIITVGLIALAAYVLRPAEQASAPIQATPLPTQVQPTSLPTQSAMPTATTQAVDISPTAESEPLPAGSSGVTGSYTYQISQNESQARFLIDEILRGSPFTAIGTTDQVAGEIAIDFDNATAQLGTVQVNARTLKTDNSFRDRAINNQILNTAQYEYITFTPTAITGLPTSITLGETITFQITGDLTIRDITRQATFDVTVTLVSLDRLQGSASTVVLRSDYNLIIPSVPSVASVSDEVRVEIDFVALVK